MIVLALAMLAPTQSAMAESHVTATTAPPRTTFGPVVIRRLPSDGHGSPTTNRPWRIEHVKADHGTQAK